MVLGHPRAVLFLVFFLGWHIAPRLFCAAACPLDGRQPKPLGCLLMSLGHTSPVPPSRYMTLRWHCASGFPRVGSMSDAGRGSAASRHHLTAPSSLWGSPLPRTYMTPSLHCASQAHLPSRQPVPLDGLAVALGSPASSPVAFLVHTVWYRPNSCPWSAASWNHLTASSWLWGTPWPSEQ